MTHSCSDALKHLVDYLEGELSPEESNDLETHLSACPPCVHFLKTYESTGKVCKEALAKDMPSEMKFALRDFLRQQTHHGD